MLGARQKKSAVASAFFSVVVSQDHARLLQPLVTGRYRGPGTYPGNRCQHWTRSWVRH
jgi:hypothetical protein